MTTPDLKTIRSADRVLKRIETGLQCGTCLLLVPAAMASQGHLPFVGWVIAPLLVAMALWMMVGLVINIGQRCGVVGTALFSKPTASAFDVLEASKREPAPVVRKADDTVSPRRESGAPISRINVAHVPGRGDVRYRILPVG